MPTTFASHHYNECKRLILIECRRDFQVIINIAMGGNVCQGQRPREGAYDFVVHEVSMRDEPEGGWGRFEQSWQGAREGNTM